MRNQNYEISNTKRTLKRRIRKSLTRSSFFTIIIFSVAIMFISVFSCKAISYGLENYVGRIIYSDMNSPEFLSKYKIHSLTYFNRKNPKFHDWVAYIMEVTDLTGKSIKIDIGDHNSTINVKNRINFDKKFLDDKKMGPQNAPIFSKIFVKLDIKDKTVFTNFKKEDQNFETSIRKGLGNSFTDFFNGKESFDIFDQNNNKIGKLEVGVSYSIMAMILGAIFVVLIIAALISLLLSKLISYFTTLPIIGPVNQLERKIASIASEDFENTMNQQIVMKKPLKEIQDILDSTNLIMQKMKYYNNQIKSQKEMVEQQNLELEAQNSELDESKKRIEVGQQKIIEKEKAVRNLLDNAGQGFLSFGKDLLILDDYSKECLNIFSDKIAREHFPKILAKDDLEQQKFIENVLQRIFIEKEDRVPIYISLLPEEIKVNNKAIHIEYKLIHHNNSSELKEIMVILTDITDKKLLENQMEQEKITLKMVIKVVVGYNDFLECMSDYKEFYQNSINEILSSDLSEDETLFKLFRAIHTFKGTFSQLYMRQTAEALNIVETKLSEYKDNCSQKIEREQLREFINEFSFEEYTLEDMELLKEVLGENFFRGESIISVEKQKLIEIENKMLSILSPVECRTLLPDIRRLRYKPLKDMVLKYSDYMDKIATDLLKTVNPLVITGGEISVDSDKYGGFVKSLVHVFRNIIDHGIELPDVRTELGKAEAGNVQCDISIKNNVLKLSISDDGAGIDTEKLKSKAVLKGIIGEEEARQISDSQIMNLIFRDGFSTKDNISELSGRGVGLAAVKSEVESLNGTVSVQSQKDQGTVMTFKIPYEPLQNIPEIYADDIIKPLSQAADKFLSEDMKLSASCRDDNQGALIIKKQKINLFKYTVFVNIKGVVNGKIIFSIDDTLARAVTKQFIFEELSEEEETGYIEETVAECSNIIIGNSFKLFGIYEDTIMMETPVTISSEDSTFSHPTSDIYLAKLKFNEGEMLISFITSNLEMVEE